MDEKVDVYEKELILFRMGGGEGSFSPVTSTNIGFSPQNVMSFNFNLFATLV